MDNGYLILSLLVATCTAYRSNYTFCPEESFRCDDGQCLNANATCNGNIDCKNGEDELVSLCGCLPNEFFCTRNMSCIALVRRCDLKNDCFDNEDEENCDTYMCPETHIKCANHFCIPKERVCDFYNDCLDGSDEMGCSPRFCWYGEFQCANGECIPPGFVCNGLRDCIDGSDESLCLKDTCEDGHFIHQNFKCNGWPECVGNHADELNCTCKKEDEYRCINSRCIRKSHQCDGVCDCLSTCDDEINCDNYYAVENGMLLCTRGKSISCDYTFNGKTTERCIAADFICDSVNDCHTGWSDEFGCNVQTNLTALESFSCWPPDNRTLPIEVVCNFRMDCLNGEDELNCTVAESVNSSLYFQCNNGQMISKDSVCNTQIDCFDKSDERNCLFYDCPQLNSTKYGNETWFKCATGQCIRSDYVCDFVQDCPDGSDEINCSFKKSCEKNEFLCRTKGQCVSKKFRCYDDGQARSGCADRSHLEGCKDVKCPPGTFKCRDGPCINESLTCDGLIHCQGVWTDEQNCTFDCNGKCKCIDRTMNCSDLGLTEFPQQFQDPVNKIYFANNNLADSLLSSTFAGVKTAIELDLTNNGISLIEPGTFSFLSSLRILTLRNNKIYHILNRTFDGLSLLNSLHLENNQVEAIDPYAFYGLSSLTTLSLRRQNIVNISKGAFIGLSNLNKLDLSYNQIESLIDGSLVGLPKLKFLDISHNPLKSVDINVFRSTSLLQYLQFDEFRFCCSAKQVKHCLPSSDEFSSCEDLMSNVVLRICIWLLGIVATLGNILVIVWRIFYKDNNRVHSFLITNLAIGDFIMGCYLLVIAVVDWRYRGEYSVHDKVWRTSRLCSFAGFLSTFSSELSVFTLTVITLDRFLAIIFPFRFTRLEMQPTLWVMLFVWVLAAFLSGLPLIDIAYFRDFYGRSGVCLALHITPEKHNGWEYSVFVFLVLNLISFSIIAVGYLSMYGAAKTTSLAVGRRTKARNAEQSMARRMTLIVATDAACWVPIIFLGILSLSGITIPKQVFAWVAVFILPLNAAINPILYTISTAAFLNPATRNLRHFNRSFRTSLSNDHGTRKTCLFHCGCLLIISNRRSNSVNFNIRRHGRNLRENEDSDYESDSFNEKTDEKLESKCVPSNFAFLPGRPVVIHWSDSESDIDQKKSCININMVESKSERSFRYYERKKRKKWQSELYD